MDVLYNASLHKDLELIEPQRTLSRPTYTGKDKYIGDYVFATKDKRLAAMYLATKGLATLLETEAEFSYIVICSDQAGYIANDKGGAIYELPTDKFSETPQEGLTEYELVSADPIKPLGKIVYEKSLDAMLEHGITVYFVNQKTFDGLMPVGSDKYRAILDLLPSYNAR